MGRFRWLRRSGTVAVCLASVGVLVPGVSQAGTFLPHPTNGQWRYVWSDSAYNQQGTTENVDVQQQAGNSFTLAWGVGNSAPAAGRQPACPTTGTPDDGFMAFQDTNQGLVNLGSKSCPPPSTMPSLCASSNSASCGNSVSSALYNVVWGGSSPVVSEPLLQGTTWNSAGGDASSGVAPSSTSKYLGQATVTVPAFPAGVRASVVQSNILQAGAFGDPYGSGIRTTWWVAGVGPVKVVFDHSGGGQPGQPAPVTTVLLLSTNLQPTPPPPDTDYFPMYVGWHARYRWVNHRHLPQPEVESVSIPQQATRTALFSFKSVSGPMRTVGQYVMTMRLDGLTKLPGGGSSAATLVKFPKLGHGRHFFTPFDLMVYGFNPVLPAYPKTGETWKSGNAADFATYGVRGSTRIVGIRTVHVPAGTFHALEVKSTLTQRGHRFGSGTRTEWFAPNRGLVKLVFHHRDGSVSTVSMLK